MGTEQDFERFWKDYPRKVGRLAAEKVYRLVRKNGATANDIAIGLERYLQSLPTDPRFIPHARTWISQGRWMDEVETVRPQPARPFTAAEIQQYEDWRRAMGGCGHPIGPCQSRQECMTKFIKHRRGEAA